MPDLSMRALAVMFQVKWKSRVSTPSSFLVKEALASFASSLEEDDVGFFYEPYKQPEICTHPGQLVGRILNSKLPYHFHFTRGVEVFASLLNSMDDGYKKIGVIVTDCFEAGDAAGTLDFLSSIKDADLYVFAVGERNDPSLREICVSCGAEFIHLNDVDELDASLKTLRNR